MAPDAVDDVIYATVLQKVCKSQSYMRATHLLPENFVIFCWLPPLAYPEHTAERSEALMKRLRSGGWPFYLKLMAPSDPGELFPAKFAFHLWGRAGQASDLRTRAISEADLSTFDPTDFESDEGGFQAEVDIFVVSDAEEAQPRPLTDLGV